MTQGTGLSATARLALLQRLSKRRARQEEAGAPEGARSFGDLPALRDFELVKTAMEALDLPNPFFRPHEGVAAATTVIGEAEYLNFSSYNYLGLNADPRVRAAAHAAIDRYGVSASASRVVSGERPLHAQLEAALAAHYRTEAALCFVSGHATNVTVIGHLMGPRDVIVHDAMIHNSCVEGARLSGARRLPFAHNDPQAAERELAAARRNAGRALLVIEGHYSMDGDVPNLARFIEIARRHDAWLMVDEAHAMGVLGPTGHGLAELQGVDPAGVDIWMGTLSKTLSSCGGYIAAKRQLIDWLRHTAPGFVYSVGLAPVLAASALESLRIMGEEAWRVAKLNANATRFRDGLRARGLDAGASAGHAIVPLMTGSSVRAGRLSAELFKRGVNVQPITFPAVPERAARLRFFLSAEHSDEQIDRAIHIIAEAAARIDTAELAG
ncbi:aminotransferase class I/II-fold pyridoxal phosphate-dependent enzyme [Roseomonas xinghualingensis]|uniref:aminotransferase class I/II-fold pyridoxal phosphate-dependent enzyme n=1 Tax=Roseomonas xinghualingensis TaxID=2986475 RepID=UPI0021F1DD95|nr:aminotransferase class I/II-fold pyridoxal phosphate-dependent enzyme [Roseomonas sp. SXEYE001]MCV4207789.1 aminotransferase class I/II-fold pyridoxal phosphate-dependent enzyme [Roseomonas sp. SXEYE001]